jgi:hypothetical protein
MPRSFRKVVVGAALLLASHVSPVSAQTATFTEIRDAVPLRYFDAQATAPEPGAPNTLAIAFAANGFNASSGIGGLTGTPLATDTISVVVNAPAGDFITSITCRLSGRGAVINTGDARAAASWVVNGKPESLGSFGGAVQFPNTGADWSSTQTITFSDPTLRSVPVSLTTQLFAFAPPAGASAQVDLTSATLVVGFASSTTAAPRD